MKKMKENILNKKDVAGILPIQAMNLPALLTIQAMNLPALPTPQP